LISLIWGSGLFFRGTFTRTVIVLQQGRLSPYFF
jgi:hypothetical protein